MSVRLAAPCARLAGTRMTTRLAEALRALGLEAEIELSGR